MQEEVCHRQIAAHAGSLVVLDRASSGRIGDQLGDQFDVGSADAASRQEIEHRDVVALEAGQAGATSRRGFAVEFARFETHLYVGSRIDVPAHQPGA